MSSAVSTIGLLSVSGSHRLTSPATKVMRPKIKKSTFEYNRPWTTHTQTQCTLITERAHYVCNLNTKQVSICNLCYLQLVAYITLYKCSAIAETGDCLATIDISQKGGLMCPYWTGELGPHLTQCGLGWGLPPYQVASWSIQPFGHNRHGPKIGDCAPFFGGGSWVSI